MTVELLKKTSESSSSTDRVKVYIKTDGSDFQFMTIDESGVEREVLVSGFATTNDLGLGNVQNTKVNLSAGADPGVTDDSSAGYSTGSIWVNTTGDSAWVCVDASVGAASWVNFTAAGSVEFADNLFRIKDNTDATKKVAIEVSGVTTGTTRTLTVPDADLTLVGAALAQTLTNKTITIDDGNFTIQDNGDNTKKAKFEASGITTATTRTQTIPDQDGTLAHRNNDNQFSVAQSFQSQAYSGTNTLSDTATIATDCNNGNVHTVTLAGNRTLGAPTNLQDGATYIWIIKQDATGSRTLAYNAVFKFPGGTAPTLSTAANSVDILTGVSDGTNVYCNMTLDFQ